MSRCYKGIFSFLLLSQIWIVVLPFTGILKYMKTLKKKSIQKALGTARNTRGSLIWCGLSSVSSGTAFPSAVLYCVVLFCVHFCCGCVGLFLSQTHTMLQPDVCSNVFRFTVIFWESSKQYIFFKFILYSQAPGETDIVDLHIWTNILLKFTARMWRGGETKRRRERKSEDRLYISHESFVLCWFKKEQFR